MKALKLETNINIKKIYPMSQDDYSTYAYACSTQ